MKKTLLLNVALCLWINCAHAMELRLEASRQHLRIMLYNDSCSPVLIDKRLVIGGGGNSEVVLDITDERGVRMSLTTNSQISVPEAEDIAVLFPDEFVGMDFDLQRLASDYDCGLSPGNYTVKARYSGTSHNKNVFKGTLESNTIKITIQPEPPAQRGLSRK